MPVKYIIIANGPFLPKEVIQEAIESAKKISTVKVIALDGATDKLLSLGIMPDLVMGDFDSIATNILFDRPVDVPELATEQKVLPSKYQVHCIHTPDQNATDLTKAINYCSQGNGDFKAADAIDVLCAVDGRIDHTLGNIRELKAARERGILLPIRIFTDAQVVQFVKDGSFTFKGEVGDQCAIMSMCEGSFLSKGLKWNGESADPENDYCNKDGFKLFPGQDSSCNMMAEKEATVTVKGEAIIMIPGVLFSQQKYKKPNRLTDVMKQHDALKRMDCVVFETTKEILAAARLQRRTLKSLLHLKLYSNPAEDKGVENHINEYAVCQGESDDLILRYPREKYRRFRFFESQINQPKALSEDQVAEALHDLGYGAK